MPETVLDTRIKEAQATLANAKGWQDMDVQRATVSAELALKSAEIAKKWIEVERDAEKLRQFKEAFRQYTKEVRRHRREMYNLRNSGDRIERFAKQAAWVLDGEFLKRHKRHRAMSAMLVLLREFMVGSAARKILFEYRERMEMPPLDSDDYAAVLDGIEELKTLIDNREAKQKEEINAIQTRLAELQQTHWKQVELTR